MVSRSPTIPAPGLASGSAPDRQPLLSLDAGGLVDLIRGVVADAVREALGDHRATHPASSGDKADNEASGPLAMSEEDAAALLGMTAAQLATQRRLGRVKATKVGRRVRYRRTDLEQFLRDGAGDDRAKRRR